MSNNDFTLSVDLVLVVVYLEIANSTLKRGTKVGRGFAVVALISEAVQNFRFSIFSMAVAHWKGVSVVLAITDPSLSIADVIMTVAIAFVTRSVELKIHQLQRWIFG